MILLYVFSCLPLHRPWFTLNLLFLTPISEITYPACFHNYNYILIQILCVISVLPLNSRVCTLHVVIVTKSIDRWVTALRLLRADNSSLMSRRESFFKFMLSSLLLFCSLTTGAFRIGSLTMGSFRFDDLLLYSLFLDTFLSGDFLSFLSSMNPLFDS